MKSDVLYMALNTILKSTRFGDARPLSIIATELRTHAGYLESTANACVAALKTLIETAADLSSDLSETMEAKDASAGAALSAAIDCINAAAGSTERDVAALTANGQEVLNLLRDSLDGLAFHGEIGNALGHGEELHRLAATALPCGDADMPFLSAPRQAWRDLHNGAGAGNPGPYCRKLGNRHGNSPQRRTSRERQLRRCPVLRGCFKDRF